MWRRKAKTPKPEVPETERFPDERPRPTPLWALLSRWLLGAEAWLRSHGGKRLRLGIRGLWGVIAAGGLFLLFGPVINPPLSLDDITSSASTATDHWIVRHVDADYRLARDDDGGLRVHVEERIEALFPDEVDESGIQRVLAGNGTATTCSSSATRSRISPTGRRMRRPARTSICWSGMSSGPPGRRAWQVSMSR